MSDMSEVKELDAPKKRGRGQGRPRKTEAEKKATLAAYQLARKLKRRKEKEAERAAEAGEAAAFQVEEPEFQHAEVVTCALCDNAMPHYEGMFCYRSDKGPRYWCGCRKEDIKGHTYEPKPTYIPKAQRKAA